MEFLKFKSFRFKVLYKWTQNEIIRPLELFILLVGYIKFHCLSAFFLTEVMVTVYMRLIKLKSLGSYPRSAIKNDILKIFLRRLQQISGKKSESKIKLSCKSKICRSESTINCRFHHSRIVV